jgi:hypothetical protein
MVIPVSYSEIHGNKPTDDQFRQLISSFKTYPTILSLAMWNLMLSLYEKDFDKYIYLQGFFIDNLIREDLQERVMLAAALESASPRPVFSRWQFLALMKRVILEPTNDGVTDPRGDNEARRTLGDACLMLNNLIFSEEQEERLKDSGTDERVRIFV